MRKSRKSLLLPLFIYIFLFSLSGHSFAAEEHIPTGAALNGEINVSSRFIELLFGKEKEEKKQLYLIPGGEVFGIRINEPIVTVTECDETSQFKRKDKILSVNGKSVTNPEEISSEVEKCGGKELTFVIIRENEKLTLKVAPKLDGERYKLGVTLKDTAAGIGTLTFIDPESLVFGGLGHGVSSSEEKELAVIEEGEALGVILGGVKKGEAGKPGELSGILAGKHCGDITQNNNCGVFGKFDSYNTENKKPLPVASRDEIKEGEAEIISTVKSGKTAKYKIEITEIDKASDGSKSFKIKVTDPMLITLTGGIVRGMSGSPIIQNGKIVGAVTHVMVSDPTEGYGIFIENMLKYAS